jgi:hypothetical protein
MTALLVIAAKSEPGLWPVFISYGLSKISEQFDHRFTLYLRSVGTQ